MIAESRMLSSRYDFLLIVWACSGNDVNVVRNAVSSGAPIISALLQLSVNEKVVPPIRWKSDLQSARQTTIPMTTAASAQRAEPATIVQSTLGALSRAMLLRVSVTGFHS